MLQAGYSAAVAFGVWNSEVAVSNPAAPTTFIRSVSHNNNNNFVERVGRG